MTLTTLLGFSHAAHGQMVLPPAAPPDPAALFTRQCGTCHALTPGEVRQGPHLAGVYGRMAGSVVGYAYSAGFVAASWTWDEAHLDAYLENPQAVIAGGVMAYRQANPATRAAIIAYLKGAP